MKFIGIAPLVVIATVITPPVGAVYFGEGAGVVDTAITPSAGALSLGVYQPGQEVTITPSAGSFAIVGIASVVDRADLITPSVGDLSVTGIAPVNDRAIVSTVPHTYAPSLYDVSYQTDGTVHLGSQIQVMSRNDRG